MDVHFPPRLFPSAYNCGPADKESNVNVGHWGGYDQVITKGDLGPQGSLTLSPKHKSRGKVWIQAEPVTRPLLSPKNDFHWSSSALDSFDFTDHMQNFFRDNCMDAFSYMSGILGDNFNFVPGRQKRHRKDSILMWRIKRFIEKFRNSRCHQSYSCRPINLYNSLLPGVIHDIPPELLGSLLYEELTEQRNRLSFSDATTGGALVFIPFEQTGDKQLGCLIYPENAGLDRLNFHRVAVQHCTGRPVYVDANSSPPLTFQLKGPVRQISSVCLLNKCSVAMRSNHLCGFWTLSETTEPSLLQSIHTRELATCINVSPHYFGEVLVASESGAAHLWSVGKNVQKIRQEDHNLYFNDRSAWRWCEFSAHPRIILYADRTGVELTDMRVSPVFSHTLFRISNTAECRSGERLILSRYLGETKLFHHLVTTQYSAYIVDERFPSVPMLKWDHMMQSPPMFCHILPDCTSSGISEPQTTNVVLGSQFSQEIALLQYSGGQAKGCVNFGSPQALLRPTEGLYHLPVQIPHRLESAHKRLASPASGLTCIQMRGRCEECLCILQLTEAGDIFYQTLKAWDPDTIPLTQPPACEEESAFQHKAETEEEMAHKERESVNTASQYLNLVSVTKSNEDAIIPPENITCVCNPSSEDSHDRNGKNGKNQLLTQLGQQVIDENTSPLDHINEMDTVSNTDMGTENSDILEKPPAKETLSSSVRISDVNTSQSQIVERLSAETVMTWKLWCQKLTIKTCGNTPHANHLQWFAFHTQDPLGPHYSGKYSSPTEDELACHLKRDLRACMTNRSLLVGRCATSLEPPEMVPFADTVDTKGWPDFVSQRLTVSWEGEESWRVWWEDQLGLNQAAKRKELRRKRAQEKAAKGATGRRMELSESFSSSYSQQLELDDFSESTGWSSAVSQAVSSDSDDTGKCQLDSLSRQTQRATTLSTVGATASPSERRHKMEEHGEDIQFNSFHQSCSSSVLPSVSQTSNQRGTSATNRTRYPVVYLSNHLAELDNLFPEEETDTHPRFHLHSASSQPQANLPANQMNLRVNLSQNSAVGSGRSRQVGPLQTSQPKKKKARMGF